jgi:hypothetical protein
VLCGFAALRKICKMQTGKSTKKGSVAAIEITFKHGILCVRRQAFSCKFSEWGKNKKMALFFLLKFYSLETRGLINSWPMHSGHAFGGYICGHMEEDCREVFRS